MGFRQIPTDMGLNPAPNALRCLVLPQVLAPPPIYLGVVARGKCIKQQHALSPAIRRKIGGSSTQAPRPDQSLNRSFHNLPSRVGRWPMCTISPRTFELNALGEWKNKNVCGNFCRHCTVYSCMRQSRSGPCSSISDRLWVLLA